MSVRRLIISDLRFGSGDDLLARPAALARDERRLDGMLDDRRPDADPGVAPAARLLRALCPTADIVTASRGRTSTSGCCARTTLRWSSQGWPRRAGTVLWATGDALELRGLLDDCHEHDLDEMLGDPRRRAAAA